jgi:hypothetical protein
MSHGAQGIPNCANLFTILKTADGVDLLLDRPWRAGIWDSWVMGKTIQRLADVEDEGWEMKIRRSMFLRRTL